MVGKGTVHASSHEPWYPPPCHSKKAKENKTSADQLRPRDILKRYGACVRAYSAQPPVTWSDVEPVLSRGRSEQQQEQQRPRTAPVAGAPSTNTECSQLMERYIAECASFDTEFNALEKKMTRVSESMTDVRQKFLLYRQQLDSLKCTTRLLFLKRDAKDGDQLVKELHELSRELKQKLEQLHTDCKLMASDYFGDSTASVLKLWEDAIDLLSRISSQEAYEALANFTGDNVIAYLRAEIEAKEQSLQDCHKQIRLLKGRSEFDSEQQEKALQLMQQLRDSSAKDKRDFKHTVSKYKKRLEACQRECDELRNAQNLKDAHINRLSYELEIARRNNGGQQLFNDIIEQPDGAGDASKGNTDLDESKKSRHLQQNRSAEHSRVSDMADVSLQSPDCTVDRGGVPKKAGSTRASGAAPMFAHQIPADAQVYKHPNGALFIPTGVPLAVALSTTEQRPFLTQPLPPQILISDKSKQTEMHTSHGVSSGHQLQSRQPSSGYGSAAPSTLTPTELAGDVAPSVAGIPDSARFSPADDAASVNTSLTSYVNILRTSYASALEQLEEAMFSSEQEQSSNFGDHADNGDVSSDQNDPDSTLQ